MIYIDVIFCCITDIVYSVYPVLADFPSHTIPALLLQVKDSRTVNIQLTKLGELLKQYTNKEFAHFLNSQNLLREIVIFKKPCKKWELLVCFLEYF